MKKRIITAVIAAILILSSVLGMTACGGTSTKGAEAVGQTAVEGTQISWEYKADTKTLVIRGEGDIPGNDDTTLVPWYSVRHSVENVEITAIAVSAVGNNAFYNMQNLKSIKLPDTVTVLGNGAFAFCSSLEAIDLPVGLTSIGERCFEACTSLKNIFVPAGVTTIGSRAFALCAKLEQAYIMSTALTELKGDTFMGCSKLTKLVMNVAAQNIAVPEGSFEVEYIEATAESCKIKVTYVVPEGVEAPKTEEREGRIGTYYSVQTPAIEGYTADKTVVDGIYTKDLDEFVVKYTAIEAETEPETEAVAETEPVDEGEGRPEKSKVGYIIAIVIFVLVIAGIVVFAVIMIKSDKKNDKNGKKTKNDKK